MAREFGGKFSRNQPTASRASQTGKRSKVGLRAKLMFFVPLPLLVTGFGAVTRGDVTGILRDFSAFVILVLAAWILREGLKAQAAYEARTNAHRPALPRKIIAADLCGLGVGIAVWNDATGVVLPLVLAALAIGLHLIAFGIDPLKSKGASEPANRRVARAIDKAEEHIDTMVVTIAGLNDRKLTKLLDSFITSAREMFRIVEDDPRDLVAARKYLSIYLMGARDATVKFAGLYQRANDPTDRADYEALLADLEKNFDAQQEQLLLDDRSDFDVEIEVLRERLRHEGVAT